jgi:hypothetical protein
MPLRLLPAAFLLAGCSEEPAPPAPEAKIEEPSPPPAPRSVPEPEPAQRTSPAASEQGAAEVLKTYHALIQAGKYSEAYRLREPEKKGATPETFVANYARYAEHRATVGTPSRIAEAGDWLYVEVPVQMYGRLKSGEPMASAGTMTLRRPKAEPNAPWRIYTSR